MPLVLLRRLVVRLVVRVGVVVAGRGGSLEKRNQRKAKERVREKREKQKGKERNARVERDADN
jgi:hypothetical protein